MPSASSSIVKILIGTVGGQGGGVLSSWLTKGFQLAGWRCQSIGLLGLSQRAGTVTYYVEAAAPEKINPVLSAYPLPGGVDLICGQELLELGRLLYAGYLKRDGVTVGNTARYYATLEKMPAAGGVYSSNVIIDAAQHLSKDSYLFNAQDFVQDHQLPLLSSNAALLGALVHGLCMDIDREFFRQAIIEGGAAAQENGKAFDAALASARSGDLNRYTEEVAKANAQDSVRAYHFDRLSLRQKSVVQGLMTEAALALSDDVLPFAQEGVALQLDYENVNYARAYLDRLRSIAVVEKKHTTKQSGLPVTSEVARNLASWMAFEDMARVASLKIHPKRFERIKSEYGLKAGCTYRVTDYFAPDMEQIEQSLPPVLSHLFKMILTPIVGPQKSFHMKINTTGFGYWMLKGMTVFKHFRKSGERFAQENALIDKWLASVRAQIEGGDNHVALLLAKAGSLIKGYGAVRKKAFEDIVFFLDEAVPHYTNKYGSASAELESLFAELAKEAGNSEKLQLRLHDPISEVRKSA